MCLPARRTSAMRAPSSVRAISRAGDFSGSGLLPTQTLSITSPVTCRDRPRAMVSTSGSSGMCQQGTRFNGGLDGFHLHGSRGKRLPKRVRRLDKFVSVSLVKTVRLVSFHVAAEPYLRISVLAGPGFDAGEEQRANSLATMPFIYD